MHVIGQGPHPSQNRSRKLQAESLCCPPSSPWQPDIVQLETNEHTPGPPYKRHTCWLPGSAAQTVKWSDSPRRPRMWRNAETRTTTCAHSRFQLHLTEGQQPEDNFLLPANLFFESTLFGARWKDRVFFGDLHLRPRLPFTEQCTRRISYVRSLHWQAKKRFSNCPG